MIYCHNITNNANEDVWIYYSINTVNRLHVSVTFRGHLYGNVYEGYVSKTSRPMYQFTIWHHLSVAGRICWDLLFRNSVSAGIIIQNSLYSLSKLTEAFNFKPATASMKSEYVSSFSRQFPVYRQWCSVPSVWQLTGLVCRFYEHRVCLGDGGTFHLVWDVGF